MSFMLFRSRWLRQMLCGSCLLFRSTPVTACFVTTARFVTFCHHRYGDKSCCQCIKLDTFCHSMFCHHGTFYRRDGDKSCYQRIKFDTFRHLEGIGVRTCVFVCMTKRARVTKRAAQQLQSDPLHKLAPTAAHVEVMESFMSSDVG